MHQAVVNEFLEQITILYFVKNVISERGPIISFRSWNFNYLYWRQS